MLARVLSRCVTSKSNSPQVDAFESLKFPPIIRKILTEKSFVQPTEIQAKVWPAALQGKDIIGIAKTGSGKTLAYALPTLMRVLEHTNNNLRCERYQKPISMIVLPTRELCKQVSQEYCKFAYAVGVKVATVYGGERKIPQIQQLSPGIHTIIGTPGRMLDLMNEEHLGVENVRTLVLDEADLMLDMGFEDQIRRLLGMIQKKPHTMMFTATWPETIQSLADEFLSNPEKILIGNSELTMNEDISHSFILASGEKKKYLLLELLNQGRDAKYLIFVNKKIDAEELRNFLYGNNIKSDTLHSDKTQEMRNYVIRAFRGQSSKIMIATDVASRGLDVKGIDCVINFDTPAHVDDYIHRVGRTGRAGVKGNAVTFVGDDSNRMVLKKIQVSLRKIGREVPEFIEELINADQIRSRRY